MVAGEGTPTSDRWRLRESKGFISINGFGSHMSVESKFLIRRVRLVINLGQIPLLKSNYFLTWESVSEVSKRVSATERLWWPPVSLSKQNRACETPVLPTVHTSQAQAPQLDCYKIMIIILIFLYSKNIFLSIDSIISRFFLLSLVFSIHIFFDSIIQIKFQLKIESQNSDNL